MSEEIENAFSGFMPMISHINFSEAISMIDTEGNLVKAHSVNIVTKNGDSYVFSMDPVDLMKLAFLLIKVAGNN